MEKALQDRLLSLFFFVLVQLLFRLLYLQKFLYVSHAMSARTLEDRKLGNGSNIYLSVKAFLTQYTVY